MGYKHYRLKVVLRLLLLFLLLSSCIILYRYHWSWVIVSSSLLLGFTIEFVYYIERSDRELANFLLNIHYNDFSNTYTQTGNPARDTLRKAYNQIMATFQRLRSERESDNQYLNTVVEHIGVALLSFGEDHQVQLMNKAFKTLFNKPYIHKIDALHKLDQNLYDKIISLKAGEKALQKVALNGQLRNLSIQATEFSLQGKYHKLVSFQDIKNELEEQEVESWQKLIRVLTHEIMNSVAPISSLASLVNQMLVEEKIRRDFTTLDEEEQEDIYLSLQTIEKRSKGLINFVKAYRSLTQVGLPSFTTVTVEELFQRVASLFKADLTKKNITLEIDEASAITIKADLELIEQILINLITNATHALEGRDNPTIQLLAQQNEARTTLQVIDNGKGMDEEVLQNIFIPFYTTKKQGSGIGLSLSRQIMRLHKGSISVSSIKNEGTVFSLHF